eukprot:TRINITY_DN4900_c0_g1_i2.p1 TRINITY_DN4900_c0_g1~~TRINITY_DN4900_c0_g1_i2.p1  ORF type:complete len:624 (+),score=173.37 TRINITY_DN4900_c0_g1_i2:114-1985(+)
MAFGGFGKTPGFGGTTGGFGKATTAAGFGANATTSGFGQPQAGGFGNKPAGTGFGAANTGGFGANKTVGFGGTTTMGGFGAKTTGFGATSPGFGAKTGGFGANAGSFGAKPGGFGGQNPGFASTGFGMNAQQQQQQQMQMQQQQAAGGLALPAQYCVMRHQDERDEIIRRFNHLQAMWGHGTYFLSSPPEQNFATAPVSANDQYNAFKGIVYNLLPDSGDREGRIGLLLNGSYDEIKANATAIEAHLQHKVLKGYAASRGSSIDVKVDTIHMVQDSKVEVIFQALDTNSKPIPASSIDKYLSQAYKSGAAAAQPTNALGGFGKPSPTKTTGFKTTGFGGGSKGFGGTAGFGAKPAVDPNAAAVQKALGELGCYSAYNTEKTEFDIKGFYPVVSRTKEQLADAMLRPEGIPAELWDYARKANPDPSRYCPVPVFGFDGLERRMQIQNEQVELHRKRVDGDFDESLKETISRIESKQAFLKSKVAELNRSGKALTQRVLKLMRSGARFDHTGTVQDFKLIQSRLETLTSNLTDLKRQKLVDLQAQLEMDTSYGHGGNVQSNLAPPVVAQVMEHLEMQQNGVQFLLKTLREDIAKLQVMENGYRQAFPTRMTHGGDTKTKRAWIGS